MRTDIGSIGDLRNHRDTVKLFLRVKQRAKYAVNAGKFAQAYPPERPSGSILA